MTSYEPTNWPGIRRNLNRKGSRKQILSELYAFLRALRTLRVLLGQRYNSGRDSAFDSLLCVSVWFGERGEIST